MVADGLHHRAGASGSRLFTRKTGDVNEKKKDSSKEFIHARQLVPAGEVYLLLPKYCCRSSISSDCRANTTEAPINFPWIAPAAAT